jgi:nucleotide-binding universal stress UspA family protein
MQLVKCPVCGGHVPAEVAVEIPIGGEPMRFCSLGCAEAGEREAGMAPAALPPLPAAPQRILVAVDGSGPSLRATELAAVLARLASGRVSLLHAIDPRLARAPSADGSRLRVEAEAQLARCRRICEAAGVPVTTRVDVSAPARAIAAASLEADLVVMGTRGLGALSGAALGSLSHRVLGETRTPVLVVH